MCSEGSKQPEKISNALHTTKSKWRTLHNSARSLHRTDRSDHRNSVVTIPAVNAENCSSQAETNGTQTNRNGQWWEQTDPDAIRAYAGDINREWTEKTKSW